MQQKIFYDEVNPIQQGGIIMPIVLAPIDKGDFIIQSN